MRRVRPAGTTVDGMASAVTVAATTAATGPAVDPAVAG